MQAPPAPQAPVPVVPVPPPAVPLAPGGAGGGGVTPITYRDKYLDPQFDPYQGNYVNLYNEYAVGNTQPAALRNSIYRAGSSGTYIHALIHVMDPTAGANDPGNIVAVHRLVRHDPRFGQLPLPFDNMGLAFFGDTTNGQLPATVNVPEQWFNQTGPVQVPTHGLLAQEFANRPNDELFGPYPAGHADVGPVITRPLIVVPNAFVLPFLTTGMRPKAAYDVLMGLIHQGGHQVACLPLSDWLRVALTLRNGAAPQPATCILPATTPAFMDHQVQQAFTVYRIQTFHQDFPHLQSTSHHPSAVLIAQGISTWTDEQRLARLEAQQRHAASEAPKTAADFFGTRLEKLLKWCQVQSEADLPPIYAEIAKTKKGHIRMAIQTAVEETLTNLKYVEDFPVSTNLATKIQELKWSSPIPDNFTLGVHVFSLGSLDIEAMETQRQINQHADALYSGEASPALIDIVTVQDSKQDVCVPRTFAQLRYLVERSEALWLVLLGSQHPVTLQHHAFREMLVTQEQRLELITTRTPAYQHIVPALLGRVIQIELNHWLNTQMRSHLPIPFTTLLDVFQDIDRQKQWEPTFPPAYLSGGKPQATPFDMSVVSSSASTAASTVTTPSFTSTTGGSAATPNTNPSSVPVVAAPITTSVVIRNSQYKDSIFGKFKALNIRARTVKEQVRKNRVAYPTNKQGENMCITFHALGLCNESCRQASDHYNHTPAEDETLRVWCETNFKGE